MDHHSRLSRLVVIVLLKAVLDMSRQVHERDRLVRDRRVPNDTQFYRLLLPERVGLHGLGLGLGLGLG